VTELEFEFKCCRIPTILGKSVGFTDLFKMDLDLAFILENPRSSSQSLVSREPCRKR